MRLTYWLTVWWLRYSRAAISRSARPSTTSPATPTSRAVGAASGADASPGSSRSSSSTETSVPPSPGTGPEWAWMVAPSPVRRVTSNRREKPVLVQLVAGRASSRCRCSSAARTSASSARAAAFSRTSGERGSLMMIAVPASLSAASAWSRACWMRSRVLIAEIADPRIRPRAPAERSSRGPNSRPGSLRASAARRPCPHPPGWHLGGAWRGCRRRPGRNPLHRDVHQPPEAGEEAAIQRTAQLQTGCGPPAPPETSWGPGCCSAPSDRERSKVFAPIAGKLSSRVRYRRDQPHYRRADWRRHSAPGSLNCRRDRGPHLRGRRTRRLAGPLSVRSARSQRRRAGTPPAPRRARPSASHRRRSRR